MKRKAYISALKRDTTAWSGVSTVEVTLQISDEDGTLFENLREVMVPGNHAIDCVMSRKVTKEIEL